MQKDPYKKQLEVVLNDLSKISAIIFESLVHTSLAGELKEWDETVSIGDVIHFELALFKNCNDVNIQLLVKLLENVNETYDSIANINNIQIEQENDDDC